jgi:hypothetical protein
VDKWYTSLAPSMVETGDWQLAQDRQLVTSLHQALSSGPEWDIDWASLVPGRSLEQVRDDIAC